MSRRSFAVLAIVAMMPLMAACTRHGAAIGAPVADKPPVATTASAAPEPIAVGGTLPERLRDPRIVVLKSQRRMAVYEGSRRVKVYAVALSRRSEGDKVREGDRRTPVGTFYVCSKNSESRFHKSLGLSYPDAEDARRGVRDGLISHADSSRIADAIERGAQPPWDTALGGEIMIHGQGAKRRVGDWTVGCVAVTNDEIDELFAKVPTGTKVEIRE